MLTITQSTTFLQKVCENLNLTLFFESIIIDADDIYQEDLFGKYLKEKC